MTTTTYFADSKKFGTEVVTFTRDRSTTVSHRSTTSADKVTSPTILAADQTATEGVMAHVEHQTAVAAGNVYGSAGASALVAVTPTENKTVDITIPAATGATYYDIFFSTDAAPKWVARVTEAQRAAGCAVTAVGTVGEGGSAGVVNVRLVGTGIATTTAPFSVNNAYLPGNATAISCRSMTTAIVSTQLALDDMRAAPALKLAPFLSKNDSSPSVWYQGTITDLAPGSAVGKALYQTYTVDVRDAVEFMVLVDTITGQGASVTVYVELI